MNQIRTSCYGCEIFKNMLPIERVAMFKIDFSLLHKRSEAIYSLFIEASEKGFDEKTIEPKVRLGLFFFSSLGLRYITLGKEKIEQLMKEWNLEDNLTNFCIAEQTLSLLIRCSVCIDRQAGKLFAIDPYDDKDFINHLKWSINYEISEKIGDINTTKLFNIQKKIIKAGLKPEESTFAGGIGQRPYFNQKYIKLFSKKEASLMFLVDFLHNQERVHDNAYLDLVVNLQKPLNSLIKSFKKIVKEKQGENLGNLYKADGRINEPDYELWHKYLLAYLLKEKGIRADLIDNKLPPKHLSRPETAKFLFPTDEKAVAEQKLDRYIKSAKNLITQAENAKGRFKPWKDVGRGRFDVLVSSPNPHEISIAPI